MLIITKLQHQNYTHNEKTLRTISLYWSIG